MSVDQYAFSSKAFEIEGLFRIRETRTVLLCDETFFEKWSSSKLRGIEFRELWNENGSVFQKYF